jgi:hypothetical protein
MVIIFLSEDTHYNTMHVKQSKHDRHNSSTTRLTFQNDTLNLSFYVIMKLINVNKINVFFVVVCSPLPVCLPLPACSLLSACLPLPAANLPHWAVYRYQSVYRYRSVHCHRPPLYRTDTDCGNS